MAFGVSYGVLEGLWWSGRPGRAEAAWCACNVAFSRLSEGSFTYCDIGGA